MIIKRKPRNILKPNNISETKSVNKRKLGFSKYRLPCDGDVPADKYYSLIVNVENYYTYSGKHVIAVYYDIAKFSDVYQKVNGVVPKDTKLKVFYIKQVYPIDSDPYIDFLESMYEALGVDYEENIDINDFIGVSEVISLGYTSKTGIGGITDRCPWEKEDFIVLYENQNTPVSSIEEYPDVECDEYGNLI